MTDEEMLSYYLRHPPAKRIGFVGWCVRAVEWALLIILGLFVMLYILPLVGAALTDAPAQGAPPAQTNTSRPQQPVAAPAPILRAPLPSCSTVRDTTTLCQPDAPAPAVAVPELPTQAPEPTATPAYKTACWTEPGERPCWLPAEAEWQPLVEVPETPVVLVPAPPLVDVCATWHAPLPWPEGCEE